MRVRRGREADLEALSGHADALVEKEKAALAAAVGCSSPPGRRDSPAAPAEEARGPVLLDRRRGRAILACMSHAERDDQPRVPVAPFSARGLLGFGAFALLCLAVLAAGGAITRPAIDGWYRELPKPWFTPPDWAFPVAWATLFACMAVAAWRVWLRRGIAGAPASFALFGAQLLFNLGWTWLFFGLRSPPLALAELAVLWLLVAATGAAFWRHSRLAGALFVPYLVWVSFAGVLNAAIVFTG